MSEFTGKPIDILLIEDNPGDVRLTKEALKSAKVKNALAVAEDGEAALDYLFKRNGNEGAPTPDLILLDLNLPKKDGREILGAIKADDELMKIPVVILTTSKAEEDIIRTYELHANCYITKPVQLKEFIDVVKSIEDFWLTIVKLPSKK